MLGWQRGGTICGIQQSLNASSKYPPPTPVLANNDAGPGAHQERLIGLLVVPLPLRGPLTLRAALSSLRRHIPSPLLGTECYAGTNKCVEQVPPPHTCSRQ